MTGIGPEPGFVDYVLAPRRYGDPWVDLVVYDRYSVLLMVVYVCSKTGSK